MWFACCVGSPTRSQIWSSCKWWVEQETHGDTKVCTGWKKGECQYETLKLMFTSMSLLTAALSTKCSQARRLLAVVQKKEWFFTIRSKYKLPIWSYYVIKVSHVLQACKTGFAARAIKCVFDYDVKLERRIVVEDSSFLSCFEEDLCVLLFWSQRVWIRSNLHMNWQEFKWILALLFWFLWKISS